MSKIRRLPFIVPVLVPKFVSHVVWSEPPSLVVDIYKVVVPSGFVPFILMLFVVVVNAEYPPNV